VAEYPYWDLIRGFARSNSWQDHTHPPPPVARENDASRGPQHYGPCLASKSSKFSQAVQLDIIALLLNLEQSSMCALVSRNLIRLDQKNDQPPTDVKRMQARSHSENPTFEDTSCEVQKILKCRSVENSSKRSSKFRS
jgi:hypothetical protein